MQQPFSLPKEPLPTTWHCPIIFAISSVDLRSEECFLNLKRNLEKEVELFQIRNSMGWWSRKQSSQGESGEERLPWLSKGSLEACEGAHCHLPPFLFLHGEWFCGSTSQACSENNISENAHCSVWPPHVLQQVLVESGCPLYKGISSTIGTLAVHLTPTWTKKQDSLNPNFPLRNPELINAPFLLHPGTGL